MSYYGDKQASNRKMEPYLCWLVVGCFGLALVIITAKAVAWAVNYVKPYFQ